MKWLASIGQAFGIGGVIAAAVLAPSMAGDGFNYGEVKVLLSVFLAGGLSGVATLFKAPPRDTERRDRADD